jgi:hypothetical protein
MPVKNKSKTRCRSLNLSWFIRKINIKFFTVRPKVKSEPYFAQLIKEDLWTSVQGRQLLYRYEQMNLTAISCFPTIVFHIWLIVVFPFFTITLFVVQDNSGNKIQALRK